MTALQDDPTQPNVLLRYLPDTIRFIECLNWQRGVTRTKVDLIVLHDMESPETIHAAEDCANWMAGKNPSYPAPKASAHYFVDSDSIVQGVNESCIAWHAPGANNNGIGIEHAGVARQTRAQWIDDFGKRMLGLSAELTVAIAKRWNIPLNYVSADGLLRGARGITRHMDVTKAFKRSTHQDPGDNFPLDWYLSRVHALDGK